MKKKSEGGITRRRFLEHVGQVGGSAAVYESMVALGLITTPTWAGPPRLEPGSGQGKRVLILGAGIGGLTAAYELSRAGYTCEVVEAQARAGGRSLTARRGSVIREESAEHGRTIQTCEFDRGLYLNMGPGRLPYHHRRVLHYCHLLDVALEVYVMETTANLYHGDTGFGGHTTVNRRIANDTRGHVAELLAKAVRKGALDEEIHEGDLESLGRLKNELLCLLKVFGDLGQNPSCRGELPVGACRSCAKSCGECSQCVEACFEYTGSTRSGCAEPLSVHTACAGPPPLELRQLLQAQFWRHRFYQPVDFEWQPTLFQPVGGMDRIVDGFVRQVGHLIEYQSEVTRLVLDDEGVEVTYRDHLSDSELTKRVDYVVSNIPLPVLQKIDSNFADDFDWAVKHARFAPTCKVGWQANARFWEGDRYQIYGGISWIDHLITQMWYPSYDYFTEKGTLTGAYNYDDNAIALGRLPLAERLRVARAGAVRLHPELADDQLVPERLGLSIAWQNVPFQRGGWADWNADDPQDEKAYERLLAPDRRFFVVGDQVSTLPGWQEGAMMSAEHVVEQIGGLRPHTVPDIRRAPMTRRLVQGRF